MLARTQNASLFPDNGAPTQDGMVYTLTLAERYPMVKEITIKTCFSEPGSISGFSPQNYVYTPDSPAHFVIPCPSEHCHDGSFNLDFVVANMLFRRTAEIEGMLYDKGGERSYLANKHLCLMEMHYTIAISYVKGYEAKPRSQTSLSLSAA